MIKQGLGVTLKRRIRYIHCCIMHVSHTLVLLCTFVISIDTAHSTHSMHSATPPQKSKLKLLEVSGDRNSTKFRNSEN